MSSAVKHGSDNQTTTEQKTCRSSNFKKRLLFLVVSYELGRVECCVVHKVQATGCLGKVGITYQV